MEGDLEKLAKEYDTCREKLITAIAGKIESLMVRSKENLSGEIPLFEFYDLTGLNHKYAINNGGFYENDVRTENIAGVAYDALDHFQTNDLLYYICVAEEKIKKCPEIIDFSGFFLENKVVWLNGPEKTEK
jgi:hypothetical protein